MIVVDSSAVAALHRQEPERKAREDRMRNALEILSDTSRGHAASLASYKFFVGRVAREGLGRDEPTNQEG